MLSWSQQKSLSNPRGATPPSSPLLARDIANLSNQTSGPHYASLPSDSDSPPATSSPVIPGTAQPEDVSFERPSIPSEQGVDADASAGVADDNQESSTVGSEMQSVADQALPSQADSVPPAIVPRRLSESGGRRESRERNGTSDEVWELRQQNASSLLMPTEGSEGSGLGDLNAGDGTTAASTLPNRAILRGRSSKMSSVPHSANKLHQFKKQSPIS